MRLAVLRSLALGLWRDRGALVMTFALPVVVFLVFAAIFSGASGDALRLRVAIADDAQVAAVQPIGRGADGRSRLARGGVARARRRGRRRDGR